jgi:hypothetical protein
MAGTMAIRGSEARFWCYVLIAGSLSIGVGLVALQFTSRLSASAVFSVSIIILCTAAVRALLQNGHDSAFWTAFALFGWTYTLVCFVARYDTDVDVDASKPNHGSLLTTAAFDMLYERYYLPPELPLDMNFANQDEPWLVYVRKIGHAVVAIVGGIIGGATAREAARFAGARGRSDSRKCRCAFKDDVAT